MPNSAPATKSNDAPAKRMRLGTKSCVECRRRKVRCIYPLGQSVCEACTAHGQLCVAQQPESKVAAKETGVDSMKRRLEELEQLVQQMRSNSASQSPLPSSSNSHIQPDTLSPRSSAPSLSASVASPDYGTPRSDSTVAKITSGQNFLHSAPLVRLFRDSNLMAVDDVANTDDSLRPLLAENRVSSICESALSLIPPLNHLEYIFTETEKYWETWPPCPFASSPNAVLGAGATREAKDMILRGLKSTQPGEVAKVIGWLALCIQQIPKIAVGQVTLALPQAHFVNVYLSLVRSLLEIDEDAGGSIDGIVAMQLANKLYLNMGRPQKAWYWARRSVSAAVSLGLHLAANNPTSFESTLWSMAWMTERLLAHLLGTPSSVSSVHPGISLEAVGTSTELRLMWHLATAIGKAIDRDQLPHASQYAATIQISQELEDAREHIPAEWWLPSSQTLPVAELYNRQRTKMSYFVHLKLLHLPYMLRSVRESRYRHSWDTAMEASRGAVDAYVFFRAAPHADADLCQQMDFQAFSGALVLILGHTTCPDRASAEEKERDWRRVEDMLLGLRRTVLAIECPVAAQAARTLEVLNAARRGGYVSPEDYTVMIPYFGKVRINARMASGGGADGAMQMKDPVPPSVMEFSMNDFISEGPWRMDPELGLETDWMDLSAFDLDFDWGQVLASQEPLV